jgi:hypothetical protein
MQFHTSKRDAVNSLILALYCMKVKRLAEVFFRRTGSLSGA